MGKKNMPIMVMMLIIMIGSVVYTAQGISMHNQVSVEETKFHNLQTSYFNNSKAVRDSAETGSSLSRDLIEIQKYPSTLLELKLVGVGKILTGIFILLFGILIALIAMPVRLGKLILKDRQ